MLRKNNQVPIDIATTSNSNSNSNSSSSSSSSSERERERGGEEMMRDLLETNFFPSAEVKQ